MSSDSIDWDSLVKSKRRTMGKKPFALPQRGSSLSFDTPSEVTESHKRVSGQPLVRIPFPLKEEPADEQEQDGFHPPYDGIPIKSQPRNRSVSPQPPVLSTISYDALSQLYSSQPQHSNDPFQHHNTSRSRHQSQSPGKYSHRSKSSPSQFKPQHSFHYMTPLREQLTPVSNHPFIFSVHHKVFINNHSYTIVDKIGSGGSSEVFRVLDENNAIKALKKVDLTEVNEQDAVGFRKEVQLLMRLKDKRRIVQIYDYAEIQNDGKQILVVVMEHGEKDLAHLLREYSTCQGVGKTELTDTKTKFYWEEMLEAVQVIHQEGIVHSDLKPANFLIVSGTIKLIDFGIASSVDKDHTHVTKENPLGTLNFMSPESIQFNEEGSKSSVKINMQSDVWSLGCILYNMVYGKLPFSHIKNPFQKIKAIIDPAYEIEISDRKLENHDPLVIQVLQRCLVRDPYKRATIEELLNHPYLRKNESQASLRVPQNKVNDILMAFSTLTPNSKKVLVEQLAKK